MKVLKRIFTGFFLLLVIADIAVFTSVLLLNNSIEPQYKISRGETLTFATGVPVTTEYQGNRLTQSVINNSLGDQFSVDLKMFGLIPFATVDVEVVDEMYVAVLGSPFGMRLYTEGVLVIDMTDVSTVSGDVNPARDAGIQIGDYIVSANGVMIRSNEDLQRVVKESAGMVIEAEVKRADIKYKAEIRPAVSREDGEFHIGMWIRDSSAGIGTLTFYSPSDGVVCGLGHGISDEDTGTLLQLNSGELVSAEIVSVEKGQKGSPGELKGRFKYDSIASISLNSDNGVYGLLTGTLSPANLIEIALKQEIADGEAELVCCVGGDAPKSYACSVKRKGNITKADNQNFLVTVTDPELLEITGGIVQGMSGSPIMQNGKLIGAVTHVLVDDPTTGYAVYAESMLETAQSVSQEQNLKDAS